MRAPAAFVGDAGEGVAFAADELAGYGVHAHGGFEGFGVAAEAVGDDEEVLELDVRSGVEATGEDIDHRDREGGVAEGEGFEERLAARLADGAGDGATDAEEGVGTEVGFLRGAVELDERLVDGFLVFGVVTGEDIADGAVDVGCGKERALAGVAGEVAIAKLDGFMGAGGGAGRDLGGGGSAVGKRRFDGEGGAAAGVEDLPGVEVLDG